MKKQLKKWVSVIVAAMMTVTLVSCGNKKGNDNINLNTGSSNKGGTAESANIPEITYATEAVKGDTSAAAQTEADADAIITLSGSDILVTGSGAAVSGSTVTITSQGTYIISGKLTDGQLIVNTKDTEKVSLILNGADIHCSYSCPVYVISAPKKVVLYSILGSVNIISDGTSYNVNTADSDAPSAAVFSMDDLKLDGEGTTYVTGNYNKGIMTKDDLEIAGGSWYVKSVDDGIRGKDSIEMTGGYVSTDAGADGLVASNDTDSAKGYITVSGGELYIEAEQDGIQAETTLEISGGKLVIYTGGGSENSSSKTNTVNGEQPGGQPGGQPGWGQWGGGNLPGGGGGKPGSTTASSSDTTSAKALKATVSLSVSGGTFSIDSSDDALHTNGTLEISGGSFYISSGDDGMHADDTLTISGGDIRIVKSYEGIEALTINLSGGNIDVVASDDGVNAAGGNDSSSMGGRPGQNGFFGGGSAGSGKINITGGNILVNASGDGIDANGSIAMSEGTVVVYGPTGNGNGSLDFDGGFTMSGGTLLAAGSSGMLQKPTGSGGIKVLQAVTSINADTLVCIRDASGNAVACFKTQKKTAAIVFCSPVLKSGTYDIYTGGSYSSDNAAGLLTGGEYIAGSLLSSVKIS